MCNSCKDDELSNFYWTTYKVTCIYMIQTDFWLNSGYFGMDYAVCSNQWTRSSLLFRRIDRSLLHTSGKN